jgi:hypothetical protein
MSTFVVWVSETGLIVSRHEEGFMLENFEEPIQLWDNLLEAKMMAEDIELNPFKVGDKVRVKSVELGVYPDGMFDVVHHVAPNGYMCLEFWEEGGVSNCVYTWDLLQAYKD